MEEGRRHERMRLDWMDALARSDVMWCPREFRLHELPLCAVNVNDAVAVGAWMVQREGELSLGLIHYSILVISPIINLMSNNTLWCRSIKWGVKQLA